MCRIPTLAMLPLAVGCSSPIAAVVLQRPAAGTGRGRPESGDQRRRPLRRLRVERVEPHRRGFGREGHERSIRRIRPRPTAQDDGARECWRRWPGEQWE